MGKGREREVSLEPSVWRRINKNGDEKKHGLEKSVVHRGVFLQLQVITLKKKLIFRATTSISTAATVVSSGRDIVNRRTARSARKEYEKVIKEARISWYFNRYCEKKQKAKYHFG